MPKKFISLLILLRPRQWIKNLFVFAPLIFSGNFLNKSALISSFSAFTFFCIASSFVYIINDVHDLHNDSCNLGVEVGESYPLVGII